MSSKSRVAFAGTPEFAVPALTALLAADVEITLVLTQPDRPAGRGRKIAPSPIKRQAQARGLTLRQPATLKHASDAADWGAVPDVLVVVAYGMLLPAWTLEWPRRGAVNVHASLLPRWRGAAPIQHAILSGEARTGVSIMKMELGLDTGPVYAQSALEIGPQETAGQLHDRLALLGATLLTETLPNVLQGSVAAIPQDGDAATYAPKLSKADAVLDWREPAVTLVRRVRAFNPWPVCETSTSDGRRLRVWEAVAVSGGGAPVGSIIAASKRGIDVVTGEGVLRILALQPASGKIMTAEAYLNAHGLEGVSLAG